MANIWKLILLLLISIPSCTPSINNEKVLNFHDLSLNLKLNNREEIRLFRGELGIIDTADLPSQVVLANLHPKVARNEHEDQEIVSLAMLDINGNGMLNDYNVDRIALVPNNWNTLNGERFMRLDFLPLKLGQSFYLYDRFFFITKIDQEQVVLSSATPTDDYLTFPYALPPLTRTTINGDTLDFRQLIDGKKLIYLEFWGTWCAPCVAQKPDIKKLNSTFGKQIIIVGISANDELSKLKEFTLKNEMTWPQIQMNDELERSLGKVKIFPLGILFDQQGNLIRYNIKPKEIINVLSEKG